MKGENFVHSLAQIEGPAIIGETCFVDRNSIIRGLAVLGASCRIEKGVVIEKAMLWRDYEIGKVVKLGNCLDVCCCCIGEEKAILDSCVWEDDVLDGDGSNLWNAVKIWPAKLSTWHDFTPDIQTTHEDPKIVYTLQDR